MVLETGSRIGQEPIYIPDLRRERLERALMQEIGGDYEKLAYENLRRLSYLREGDKVELNPQKASSNSKIINLFRGILKTDWVSVDFYPRDTVAERPTQTNIGIEIPYLYHLWMGRMGVYSGESFSREYILHDWGEDFLPVNGVHKLVTFDDQPAFVLATMPRSSGVPYEQIHFPK